MFREIIDYITGTISWIKRKRIYEPDSEIVKVNFGCGLTVEKGWLNIDASLNAFFSSWPRFVLKGIYGLSGSKKHYSKEEYCDILKDHTFIHHNVEYGLPFPDNSVDYLYSSHLLEHLFREDAIELLEECYRVLKKDGVVRICIPDLEHAISLYENGNKQEALNYFFTTTKSGYYARHQYMYDFEVLSGILRNIGFSNVTRYSYSEGKVPDIESLDNRPDETLYLEAKKE